MKASFHDKADDSNTSNKDTFETLQIRKFKWTPHEGQLSSLDFFIKKCRHDTNKLKFNRDTKFSILSSEEWSGLKSLKKRKEMVIKAAQLLFDGPTSAKKEAQRQLSDISFYAKVDKDLTLIDQTIVKNTINALTAKQELPATAKISSLPLLELRVFTSYLKSTNLTTRVDPSFLPPPNLFPAIV